MKKLSFILFVLILPLASCSNEDSTTQEQDQATLDKMYQEIIQLSGVSSQPCTDPSDWSFTAIATKPCGGAGGYIAYSKKIDTKGFLDKVKTYTDSYDAFNKKWSLRSTCDVVTPPTSVKCVDNKPQLSYDPVLH